MFKREFEVSSTGALISVIFLEQFFKTTPETKLLKEKCKKLSYSFIVCPLSVLDFSGFNSLPALFKFIKDWLARDSDIHQEQFAVLLLKVLRSIFINHLSKHLLGVRL